MKKRTGIGIMSNHVPLSPAIGMLEAVKKLPRGIKASTVRIVL